jgi:hypothetical protein
MPATNGWRPFPHWVNELREFGLARSGIPVPLSRPAIAAGPEATVQERLKGLMAAVAAEVKSTSAEQHAMLDLARMHDVVMREQERGTFR